MLRQPFQEAKDRLTSDTVSDQDCALDLTGFVPDNRGKPVDPRRDRRQIRIGHIGYDNRIVLNGRHAGQLLLQPRIPVVPRPSAPTWHDEQSLGHFLAGLS
jgi:hypothetical protein